MHTRLRRFWEQLRSSFWFVPGLMAIGAVFLVAWLATADWALRAGYAPGIAEFIRFEASGARAVLSTIASAAITVTGVVFSITILVLSTASSQFGPRLLRNFMEHGSTQWTLGGFGAVFIYSLLVLVMVTEDNVPQLSVLLGVVLGVTGFLLLVYFVHHVAIFIQAPRILDDVALRLNDSLKRTFPKRENENPDGSPEGQEPELPRKLQEHAEAVCATRSGYLQGIDFDGLMNIAKKHDLIVKLLYRPGHFVTVGRPFAMAAPAGNADEEVFNGIRSTFLIGPQRTPTQDPEFAVHQLVEVALRALSPGINDPYTAINCLDRLGEGLSELAAREIPSAFMGDAEGRTRVITTPYTYAGIVGAALNQIRQSARHNVAVTLRILEIVEILAEGPLPDPYRDALLRQIEAIYEARGDMQLFAKDGDDFLQRYQMARRALLHESEDSR